MPSSFHLNPQPTRSGCIPSSAMQDLKSNEIRLAALVVPVGIAAEMADVIRVSIDQAFVFAFRLVMMICAGMSIASASFAWRMMTPPSPIGRRLEASEAPRKG